MKWKEFKESVDNQLKEMGLPEDCDLGVVDGWFGPSIESQPPVLTFDKKENELNITS